MSDSKKTAPPLPRMWEAYRDLFKLIEAQNKWSRDNLVDALNRDAEKKIKPKCTYDRRSTEYWEERPKPPKPPRIPRIYRQEHLHEFFSENLVMSGKSPEYIARAKVLLTVITPRANITRPMGFVQIDISRFVPGLKPLSLRYEDLKNIGDLADRVYTVISGFVKPFTFGQTWILKNKKTGMTVINRRISEGLGHEYPVRDPRPLIDENITPGTELEALMIE